MIARFVDFPLRLLQPSFDSLLADVVIELESLRRLSLEGDTPSSIFFQLKDIFHLLESLGSARIEGNHTTLADYIESKIDAPPSPSDQIKEVQNIERAMDYVEEAIAPGGEIPIGFIRELHHLTVSDLEREGDSTPGNFRTYPVSISGASHLPPDHVTVPAYMEELVRFINRADPPKYDLLKMALAHHRFCWIHPFGNGNGRVIRLLSYAILIKAGFNVRAGGRVLNPTAVFCNNRNLYYENLAAADTGTDEGLSAWCLYVLGGIRDELQKVDRLTRYDYLKKQILFPALALSLSRKWVTPEEAAVLNKAITLKEFKADDVRAALPSVTDRQRTYLIQKLVKNQLIRPIREGARSYSISFSNNYLLRGVIKALEEEGFIPQMVQAG